MENRYGIVFSATNFLHLQSYCSTAYEKATFTPHVCHDGFYFGVRANPGWEYRTQFHRHRPEWRFPQSLQPAGFRLHSLHGYFCYLVRSLLELPQFRSA